MLTLRFEARSAELYGWVDGMEWDGMGWDGMGYDEMGPSIFVILCGYIVNVYIYVYTYLKTHVHMVISKMMFTHPQLEIKF